MSAGSGLGDMVANNMTESCMIWRVTGLLVVFACFLGVMQGFLPSSSCAVGMYKDEFWPAQRRSGGSIFSVPEIYVGLKSALSSTFEGLETYRVERWERIFAERGFIVGYVKRDHSGRLKMCACTKLTTILSPAVRREIDIKRQMHSEKLTDYDDMELDKKIENDCLAAGTYQGCVDIIGALPNPPVFCNAFHRELNRKVVPLAFSKQSYFDPGLRIMQNTSKPGEDGKYFGASSVYIGEYEGYKKGKRQRGQTRFICPSPGASLIARVGVAVIGMDHAHSWCDIPDADDLTTGYSVIKRGDEVCLNHRFEGVFVSDCVPSPSLSSPEVVAASNGLRIKFPNCKNRHGADSKYCDFTLSSGESDGVFGFAVIKPRLDIDRYSLQVSEVCTNYSKAENKCHNYSSSITEDPEGNVTCFISPDAESAWSYLRRGDRYHWLRKLPKALVAHSYDYVSNRRLQCGDEKSIDLASMAQEELDKMLVRGRNFSFPEDPTDRRRHEGVLCHSGLTYSYTNHRAFLHDGECASSEKDGVISGYCRTKYESLDDFQKVFLSDKELPSDGHVFPLNPILQGYCVSNFPSHEYKVVDVSVAPGIVKAQRSYVLEVSPKNTTCDLLKIEMWGAGESGSIHTGRAGKSGEYAMGILKLNLKPQEQKFLKINVGLGGSAYVGKRGGGNDPGATTEVFLCDSADNNSNCPIQLFAKGGGLEKAPDSLGLDKLVHYRVAEGLAALHGANQVFIPYQNPSKYAGYAFADEVGCVRGGTAASAGTKTIPISDMFPGAGGCARADINVLQGGANGRVKITCEKWSGPVGSVKQWEHRACNEKLLDTLTEVMQYYRLYGFSEETKGVLQLMASERMCGAMSASPAFVKEVERILEFVTSNAIPGVTTKQSVSTNVNSLLRDLDNKLGSSPVLLSDLTSVVGGAAGLSEQDVRVKVNTAFTEVLSKKAVVLRSVIDFRKMAKAVKEATTVRTLRTTLDLMCSDEYVENFARDKSAMDFLSSVVFFLNSPDPPIAYYTEALRSRSIRNRLEAFRGLIKNRNKFAQRLETKLFGANQGGGPLDDARFSAIVEPSVRGLEQLLMGMSEVLIPEEGDYLKMLVKFKEASRGMDARTKQILARLATVRFTRNTIGVQGFVAEVSKISKIIDGPKKTFKSAPEAKAYIGGYIGSLQRVVAAEPEVYKAFIRAMKHKSSKKETYTRDDLHAAIKKILEQHVVVEKAKP